MLIFQDAWRPQKLCRPDREYRSGITHAVGFHLPQGLVKIVVHVRQVNFRVYTQDRLQVFRSERAAGVTLEPCCQLWNPIGGQTETSRLGVATIAVKELSNLIESFNQVEPGNRPPGPVANPIFNRNHQCGQIESLYQTLGHNSDDAPVPPGSRDHEGIANVSTPSPRPTFDEVRDLRDLESPSENLLFHLLPFAIPRVQALRDLARLGGLWSGEQVYGVPGILHAAGSI